MTPQVSIIVPCYNAAPYLPKCLKSILRQTFTDIEVIAVNDGSNDDTLAVLERYAAKDQRIRIINAPHNCGLQWARHRGIKAAQGQWIMFVDAD
ncbi:MAG: glycosyltransferase family 2 protein, partial [Muribaculaceae bacterium]|nr:glycosyltransferase family 2 protein [Muribaculaceae bacterium]